MREEEDEKEEEEEMQFEYLQMIIFNRLFRWLHYLFVHIDLLECLEIFYHPEVDGDGFSHVKKMETGNR